LSFLTPCSATNPPPNPADSDIANKHFDRPTATADRTYNCNGELADHHPSVHGHPGQANNMVKYKVKVKVKVKVKFTPEQATKAQRGSKGTALLFL
jgi:hypothetical protein